MWNHARLDCSHQLATILMDANDNFTCQAVDPGIALGPVCIFNEWNWDAGRSTASSNHCSMVANFRERLGSKLAAHRHLVSEPDPHHGRAPLSILALSRHGRKAFRQRSNSASIPEMFRGSFSGLSILKFILFQSKSSSNAQPHSHVDLKFKNAIPETETAYIICPHTIV